jgi:hypothetical protein
MKQIKQSWQTLFIILKYIALKKQKPIIIHLFFRFILIFVIKMVCPLSENIYEVTKI